MVDREHAQKNRIKTALGILVIVAAGAAAGYGALKADEQADHYAVESSQSADAAGRTDGADTGEAAGGDSHEADAADAAENKEQPGVIYEDRNERDGASEDISDGISDGMSEDAAQEDDEIDDWRLILINPWNPLPEDFEVETAHAEYGKMFDARAVDDLEEMMQDCRDEGYSPLICSAFRHHDDQVRLFENDVRKLMYRGYSEEEAREETARNVAVPGTSEHEAGLAADIVYSQMQALNESQEDNGTQQWLMEHSWEYGFVLRYPEDKTEITGITYEPWHYRYVGREAAKTMYENNLCLEEYLECLKIARRMSPNPEEEHNSEEGM